MTLRLRSTGLPRTVTFILRQHCLVTIVDAFKAYVWLCGQNHRHKKLALLDFTGMMCKDLLENGHSANIEYTSGTTYSISPMSHTSPGGLLNGFRSIDVVDASPAGDGTAGGDGTAAIVGNSQLSDLTMSPLLHSLVKTMDMETYGYKGGRLLERRVPTR